MFEREPITAGELMDKQFLPKPVIVEGMLPAGTYILAGTPKIGKSFLMTQLCWSLAEGIPFLGLATRKSTVLLAPGTHSHFESGKFSQFWPEPGTNPAQWVRLKTPFRVHPKQPN